MVPYPLPQLPLHLQQEQRHPLRRKKVGDAVKAGDAVIIEESMKMEIPMVAPKDGTIASIDCAVGDAVEAGTVLATLN